MIKTQLLCLMSLYISLNGCKSSSNGDSSSVKDSVYTGDTKIVTERILTTPFSPDLESQLILEGYQPEANCVAVAFVRNPNLKLNNRVIVITNKKDCTSIIVAPKIMLTIPMNNAPFKFLYLADGNGVAIGDKPVGGFYHWAPFETPIFPQWIDFLCSGTYQYADRSAPHKFDDYCTRSIGHPGTIDSIIPRKN